MKRTTKTWLISAGVLIFAGAIIFAASYYLGARPEEIIESGALNINSTGFGGSVRPKVEEWGNRYSTAGDYTLSTNGFSGLDIEWVSGSVMIEAYDGESIVFSETSDSKITSEKALRYTVEEETLKIYFCQNGVSNMPSKNLKVRVPRTFAENMKSFECDTTSATLTVSGFKTDSFDCSAVSGRIEATNMIATDVSVNSTSGNLYYSGQYVNLDAESVSGTATIDSRANALNTDVSTTSGKVILSGDCGDVSVETVSGSISSDGAITAREFDGDSASGKIELIFDKCPEQFEAETISGSVTVSLPRDSEFTVQCDTISGKFKCDFEVVMNRDTFICGNGSSKFDVNTASGSFFIKTA